MRFGSRLEHVNKVEKNLRDLEEQRTHERATEIALGVYEMMIRRAREQQELDEAIVRAAE